MNAYFTNIKVDKEEHPNVDAIYMKAVQIMTGRGGWPLNVVTLPDGRPIWGETILEKEEWINTLQQLQQLYSNSPEKIFDYAEKLHEGILTISTVESKKNEFEFNQDSLKPLIEKWEEKFRFRFWRYGSRAKIHDAK